MAISDALEMSHSFVRETMSMLLRTNMLENLLVYNPQNKRFARPSALIEGQDEDMELELEDDMMALVENL